MNTDNFHGHPPCLHIEVHRCPVLTHYKSSYQEKSHDGLVQQMFM